MIFSLNEIESLALKAARGAGMSWGLAEEAALAASWLATHGLPWAQSLVALLAEQPQTCPPRIDGDAIVPSRIGGRLCPVFVGALLSDLGTAARSMEVRDVLAPLWLAPFLARWVRPGSAVRLAWAAFSLSIEPNGLPHPGVAPGNALSAPFTSRAGIVLGPASAIADPPRERPLRGYCVPDDAWRALQVLERRTYVPASAHSRLSGAGAGLLDND
jgi:hypothetical protein